MKAVKGNKEYNIEERQQKSYQDAGFDIFDDGGKLIAYGKGKTVPYGDYMKLKKELEAAMAENETLKQATKQKPAEEKAGAAVKKEAGA